MQDGIEQEQPDAPIFRFGPCRLDVSRRQLWVDGQPVPLPPRVFTLMVHLVRNSGVVLSKAELVTVVWPDGPASDDMLVGAVRKLRRAVGDSGPGSAVHVETVFGIGYRLDTPAKLELQSLPALGGGLAVLRVSNDTHDENFNWACDGLACLIHYRLSQVPGMVLLPLSATLASRPSGDNLEEACVMLGAQQVLSCKLGRQDGLLQLQGRLGSSDSESSTVTLGGSEPGELASRLVATLGISAFKHQDARDHGRDMFIAGVLALERQGDVSGALESLEHSLAGQAPDAEQAALLARLLRLRGRLEDGRSCVLDAISRSTGAQALHLKMELALTLLRLYGPSSEYKAAVAELSSSLEAEPETPPSLRALCYSVMSTAQMLAGQQQTSLQQGERAMLIADRAGDPVVAIETRLRLAWANTVAGQHTASLTRLDEAQALAHKYSLALLEANCWLMRSYGLASSGRSMDTLHALRECLKLSPQRADLRMWLAAQVFLVSTLNLRGLLEESAIANLELQRVSKEARLPEMSTQAAVNQVMSHWMHGESAQAIGQFRDLVASGAVDRLARTVRINFLSHFCELLLLTDHFAEAEQLFAQLQEHAEALEVRVLCAVRYLRHGQRLECMESLRAGIRATGINYHAFRMRLSLAWLLLEDGDVDATRSLLEELEVFGVDWHEVAFLRYALLVRDGRALLDEARWRELARRLVCLTRFHPWLAEPQTARDLIAGRSRRLPELLMVN